MTATPSEGGSALDDAIHLADQAVRWVPLDAPIRASYRARIAAARLELAELRAALREAAFKLWLHAQVKPGVPALLSTIDRLTASPGSPSQ